MIGGVEAGSGAHHSWLDGRRCVDEAEWKPVGGMYSIRAAMVGCVSETVPVEVDGGTK